MAADGTSQIIITLNSEQDSIALAAKIATIATPGDIIALHGDLGVGKSVFARAFIRARCGEDEEVPSPTFTLVQYYEDRAGDAIYHFDLYRLEQAEEALELDIEDAFSSGISLIEWPLRLGAYLPWQRLDITIDQLGGDNARRLTITGPHPWMDRLESLHL